MARTNLGFGLMRLPCTDSSDPTSIDLELFSRMADRFLQQGYTYFDTAYPYHNGKSEEAFREAVVKRHPRDRFTITDKMPVWLVKSPEDYARLFHEQLQRCGVSFFDYYWLHALNASRYEEAKRLGGFDFLRSLRTEGKARHIGFSFHDKADVLERILTEQPDVEYVQLQINYMDWEDATVQAEACYETARSHGKQVIIMEPIKGGCLATIPQKAEAILRAVHPQWSNVQWALAFVASLSGVHAILSGMSDLEQVEENTSLCSDLPLLGAEEQQALQKAREIIKDSIAITCTACGYCKAGCPKKIDIPLVFNLYNNLAQYGMSPGLMRRFRNNVKEEERPSACIRCRQCERACPQHLPITTALADAAKAFEG
ncbi:MAG: aldo/keto reductase [Sphaerochaeta sp.]|nr:aldo/keto reductase [Sphaerochaeta sp.]MCH3919623.1 aldo/keto reductase [Sphaerochaeta sp.]MCI2044843.1 aldo/keto reductase [Sphaerochaeta sp.]MCI2075920.1 aldo/keto reductase [Sphaerochaeta sp.]MCI2097295.1 aldo/keto reductase [Sphaerochaeta sp.]